jgi:rhodanese-related sulfurtransferase
VAVAVAEGRRHLVSAWPASTRSRLLAALDRGAVSYADVLADLVAVEVPVDPVTVRNVNRPADLPGQRYPRPAMTVQEISVDELAARLAAGARLVDVREPSEYEDARVPGAVLVPLGEVPSRIEDFRSEGTTYVICRSGARSMRACEFLAERGLDVANVAGGTLAWIESGRDVAAGPA